MNSSPPSRPTWPWSPITLVSRCATCAKQRVADRVAERVVDVLEAVEVDQEQRAALVAARGVAQRFVERLAHQRAIGQAGERIEAREAADFLFRAALLGEVGADPAEAEEAPALVEDRIARQRPVDVLIARRADTTSLNGKRADRWKPSVRSSRMMSPAWLSTDSKSVNWRPSKRFGRGT